MSTLVDTQFEHVKRIAKDLWGLNLTEKKRQLVSNRVASYLRKTKRFSSVDAYLDHLQQHAGEEDKLVFFDILSTNVTSFFRDPHHFDFLERELYTPLARKTITLPGRRIRLWSAACSTGAEPYTMAMHAMESLPDIDSWDIKILATDLSNSALAAAKAGVYPEDMVKDLPRHIVTKYFLRGSGQQKGMVRVTPQVRDMVTIRRANLMDAWPFKGPFDAIFVRNVMIYFDKPTRTRLINRMAELMRPGSILAVGSAETLSGLDTPLKSLHASFYVK